MAGIVYLTLYISVSLSFIEVISSHGSARRDGSAVSAVPCVPGDVFQGPGCGKCFCDVEGNPICSPEDTCKRNDEELKLQELIRDVSRVKLLQLPKLASKAEACTPGRPYRVDCNRCICSKEKTLLCQDLRCLDYDEVNELTAREMSGKACSGGNKTQNCITCVCNGGSYTCKAKNGCIPSLAFSLIAGDDNTKHGCVPGQSMENPNGSPGKCVCTSTGQLSCPGQGDKRSSNLRRKAECLPGSIFDNPNGGPKCWCTILAQMYCPPKDGDTKALSNKLLTKKKNHSKKEKKRRKPNAADCVPGKMFRLGCNMCVCDKHLSLKCTNKMCLKSKNLLPVFNKTVEKPFDKALLGTKKCTPGVVYHTGCNTCTCTEGNVLKCTLKQCLSLKIGQSLLRPRPKRPVVEPIQMAFLDGSKKCTPGVLYKNKCNKCTCTENSDLQCTRMSCLDAQQAAILNKVRIRLQKDYHDN